MTIAGIIVFILLACVFLGIGFIVIALVVFNRSTATKNQPRIAQQSISGEIQPTKEELMDVMRLLKCIDKIYHAD